jgi:hypothetical protein
MLSAQKQEMPEDTPPENSSPPASGFGKVLSSIQGLQQRLDDFSVEEVSRAHAKAGELIQQLGALQARLNALGKLKRACADTAATTASAPEIDYDLIDADSLENHPQLRAILQADKLIRTHRLVRPAQRSANSASSESPTDPVVSGNASEPLPSLGSKNETPTARPDASPLAAPGAFTLVSSSYEPSSGVAGYDFPDLKLDHTPPSASRRDVAPAQREEHAADAETKKTAGNGRFNERLLNELIDAYGEFAVSVEAASNRAAPATSPPTLQNHPSPRSVVTTEFEAPPAPSTDVSVAAVAKKETTSAEITAPEPAFVDPTGSGRLALPAPEEAISEPAFEQTLPNAKARGEIDRQLKNIIKDYGEVDLYSHRKSVNTKTAAIAAAAVLALVLGGIFFFKAPSSNHSPAPIEAVTSGTDAEPAASPVKNPRQKN